MKLKYYCALLGFFLIAACTKVEVVTPDFEVVPKSNTAKVGEEVTFLFSGDPDQISFYSGEPLSDYGYKTGRILKTEGMQMSFTTTVANGGQLNQLSILASTDFSGNYEMSDIKAATWIDITSNYPLSTNATQVLWGPKDVQSMMVSGKPIYIAFRYITLNQAAMTHKGPGRSRAFELKGNTILGKQPISDLPGAGFKLVHEGPLEPSRASVGASSITLRGNNVDLESRTEDWAISKPIVPVGDVDLGPDKPTPVKGFVDTKTPEYKYIYTKPGTYIATFVASNANIYGAKKLLNMLKLQLTRI